MAKARRISPQQIHRIESVEALRESEEQLRLFVERAPAALAMFDREMRYICTSQRWLSDYGLEGRQLRAQSHYEVFPEISERWREIHRRCLEGQMARDEEDWFERADGSVQWLRWEVRPWHDVSGQIAGIVMFSEDITERKIAEQALAREEQRYRLLFEDATEGIALADAETGILLDCNQSLLRLTGYAKSELIGRPQSILHPPEEIKDGLSRTFALHSRERADEVLETQIVTKTGSHKWVEVKASVLEIEGRKVLQGFFRDVTEERRGQREREITLALLRLLNDNQDLNVMIRIILEMVQAWTNCSAVGIRLRQGDALPYFATRGFDPRYFQMEKKFCRRMKKPIAGEGNADSAQKCPCENILEGSIDQHVSYFETRGSFWTNSTQMYLAKKNEAMPVVCISRWCHAAGYESLALIPLSHGERIFGLLQVNDQARGRFSSELISFLEQISDQIAVALAQRYAESALRQSEEKYRQIVETANEGICAADENGVNTFANQRFADMLGYTPDELVGMKMEDFVFKEDLEDYRLRMARRAEGKIDLPYERRYRRRDGEILWMTISATPLRNPDGSFAGSFGMFADITKRKRAEEERAKLQSQLEKSQRLEAIGQLAGGVAHDFNNLLQAIFGHVYCALAAQEAGKPCVDDLQQIKKSAESAAGLTRQLLAFGRRQILQPVVLDLNEVLQSSLKMLTRLIGEDIILTATLSPSISVIRADPIQIEQVIINLAVNARDAMPQGGQLVLETRSVFLDKDYCRVNPDCHPGRYVMLSVKDTGCGMAPEVRARIFEPFFTTKGPGKGTGLGLATVFGIVKQSEGYIEVESAEGAGTTFRIYLPAADAKITVAIEEGTEKAPQGTETILLAEDDDASRRVSKQALEAHGYKVLEAANGYYAVGLAEVCKQCIHLLVTDVVMPEMGGRELSEILTKRDPRLKVLFVTGYTDDVVLRQGIEEADAAFLQKPFSPLALARKVREVLDGS